MKVVNLNKKSTETIFEIIHMYGDNGECEGYFTTLEEAKKRAMEIKESHFENDNFFINEMVWSEEEQEYLNQYDTNGGLIDSVEVV